MKKTLTLNNKSQMQQYFSKEFRDSYSNTAKNILEKLTIQEKIELMSGKTKIEEQIELGDGEIIHYCYYPYLAGGNPFHQIPELAFCDGPRGVVCGYGKSTCFPVSMARGATFDVKLEERIGQAIGKEVKAYGGNFYGGVCVNLPYHPGWGRSQETYGEESFLIGQMGSALVKGVQTQGVIACVKHLAFNSMENARFWVSVVCDKRTEREVFLPHFKDCIDAGAASVMTAYNQYLGIYCGHHSYLINEILKNEWGFDGFVISDFNYGIRETVAAANAGMDVEMANTNWFGKKLLDAVNTKQVNQERIQDAALRIVRTLISVSEFGKDLHYSSSILACEEHLELALEAAEKSITLLKNDKNILPLSKQKIRRIAIVGSLGDQPNTGDYGSSRVYPPYVVTLFDGIANLNCCEVLYTDGSDIESAKELARTVDAVVLAVGYNQDDEGEYVPINDVGLFTVDDNIENLTEKFSNSKGGDRTKSLSLHTADVELIRQVSQHSHRSIVVMFGGNMILMEEWKDIPNAILMAYYPGMEGGTALAKIIFGDVNPSGKLPFVQVEDENHLPKVDWNARIQNYEYFHGYTKLEKEGIKPALPFGFGLSYTRYLYSNANFFADDCNVYASCEVENIGGMEGEEVVQFYVGFDNSKIDRPHKVLRGFQRVHLQPKEKKKVLISCPLEKLFWYNEEKCGWELEHMYYQAYIGPNSSDEQLLIGEFFL